MPIISQSDLSTNLYSEIITEIVRTDSTVVPNAIANAIDEAKAYLNRFDLLKLFGDDTVSPVVPASVNSSLLTNIVKDMTVWWIIKLANPNISYEHARVCYEDAIDRLKMIQRGTMTPANWPLMDYSGATTVTGDGVYYNTNTKRNTNF